MLDLGMLIGVDAIVIPSMTTACLVICEFIYHWGETISTVLFCLFFSFSFPGTYINSSEERRILNWGCGSTVQVQERNF